ncbi:hypothetical protein EIN_408570 [Entamoeba invadens IP1]|uniref:TLDc domain-containing protein n=1 Tax=Entamoeba invadens IP1 TaxID=370355 RepID=A0A0A1U256_ENTIV|nr:hypothetical protein EIN_408570 [Entamoeba invadens IP1]ELP85588.1 hypothetical protein EIN_408570 [Entamoeba invadens IP1]|eukprot:XP_004184934.1 hypothetical protein EIN_408570 [Entamoeba invadens IP1]
MQSKTNAVPSKNEERTPDEKLSSLFKWTRKSEYDILYDSDEMPYDRTHFQRVIYGRQNVMGIIITDKGEVFGSFHPKTLPQEEQESDWVNDNNYFVFKINDEMCKFKKSEKMNTEWSLYLCNENDYSANNFYCVLSAFGLSCPLNDERSGMIRRGFSGCYTYDDMLVRGDYDNFHNIFFKPSRLILIQWY